MAGITESEIENGSPSRSGADGGMRVNFFTAIFSALPLPVAFPMTA
jgi:hypothetical protein